MQTADWIPPDVRQKIIELVSGYCCSSANANSYSLILVHLEPRIHTDTQYAFISFFSCIEQSKNRINKAGELLVTSELSRSQRRNLEDCLEKISSIIAEASEKPREPTPEDLALRAVR